MINEEKPRDIRERTFNFAIRIVKLYQVLDEKSGVGRILGKQLLRSGTSIGANLEEAYAGQSKPNFINKNAIALNIGAIIVKSKNPTFAFFLLPFYFLLC